MKISHSRPTSGITPRSSLEGLRDRPTCSIDEAVLVLGIGRSTAYAAAREGSLPVLRVRNRLLVPVAKLMRMLGCDEAADGPAV